MLLGGAFRGAARCVTRWRAPSRYTPRRASETNRPATCRYLTGLHKQTRYHRARASSIAPAVALLPLGGVPYYHHHTVITAKPERRAMPRRNGHTELRPSPRNQDT